jgi:endoglycosylceramidase
VITLRRLALALLVAIPLVTAPASAAPVGHAGRWLTDGRGRVLVPHGLNMVYKRPPYAPAATGFGADDARFLAVNGFDVVRLGVILGAVEPQPGIIDQVYLDDVARTVATLGANGILTLLDFHQDQYEERFHGEGFPPWMVQDDGLPHVPDLGFPGNYTGMRSLQTAFDHFWADAPGPGGVGLQERYVQAWQAVAQRFAANDGVLGYDLFNEPWPGTDWPKCVAPSGCPAFDAILGAFERKVITAIRSVDGRHLVFYEPNVLFNQGYPTRLPSLGDARAAMSFHDYCQGTGTSARLCAKSEQRTFRWADERARTSGDALLLTEFGAVNDLVDLAQVADFANAHRVGWIEWAYCGCSDPTGSVPPDDEALVVDPARVPAGANVRTRKLAVLARPEPRAVAGTPLAWAFDVRRRRFTLAWATRPPGGARLRSHTTEVSVPRLQYPRGYRVRVRGGRVVSPAGSRLLRVRAAPGARRVSLMLLPR